ncbi:hypothetical protein, partial [Methylobacterium sp. J-077]|uniref:hypothetical protein n=1 Tax=Methylobacterium sp. J-077 TaxID=2836656 RepID=UPI001FB8E861
MQDEPSGATLLDAARRALIEDLVPGVAGRPVSVALSVADAIGIAARAIAQPDRRRETDAQLLGAPGVDARVDRARAFRAASSLADSGPS